MSDDHRPSQQEIEHLQREQERMRQYRQMAHYRHRPQPAESRRGLWIFIALMVLVGGGYYVYTLPYDGGYAPRSPSPRDSKQDTIDQLRDEVYFLRRALDACKSRH